MKFQVRNVVVKAQLCCSTETLSLKDFMPFASVQFTHRPTMAKFYHSGLTILIFSSLKCRSMGLPDCTNDLNEIAEKHKEILRSFCKTFPWPLELTNISMSTSTVTHQILFPVSLHAGYFLYEPELFSAAKLRVVNESAHVNVFANGKVILLGIKSQEHAETLLHHLYTCVHK